MSPIKHIRKNVFAVRQDEFAGIAGVHQGTVSKWERRTLQPDYDSLVAIRRAARERGLVWDDSFFFDVPDDVAQQERNDCPV